MTDGKQRQPGDLASGIDPWDRRLGREELHWICPLDIGGVPTSDEPIPRLPDGQLTFVANIKVIFTSDGNVDKVAGDVFACGADGIRSEPYTDWPEIARKHPGKVLTGQGDNRTLSMNDREAIERMVKDMVALDRSHPGYIMSIGNLIPWNLEPNAVKMYFDAAEKLTPVAGQLGITTPGLPQGTRPYAPARARTRGIG